MNIYHEVQKWKDSIGLCLGLLKVSFVDVAILSIYSNMVDIFENSIKWRCLTYLTHIREAVLLSYPVCGVPVGHLYGPVISEDLPVAQGE